MIVAMDTLEGYNDHIRDLHTHVSMRVDFTCALVHVAWGYGNIILLARPVQLTQLVIIVLPL